MQSETSRVFRILVAAAEPFTSSLSARIRELGHEPVEMGFPLPKFDLALVDDVAEPGIVARLKLARESAPCLALIERLEPSDIEALRGKGFDDLLLSPLTLTALQAKIQMWLPLKASRLVIDLAPLRELETLKLEDGSRLVPTLVDLFLSSRADVRLMRDDFAAGELPSVRALAHNLKSSAASLGLVRLKCVCHKIELADSIEDMRIAIALLPMEFDLAVLHLERAGLSSRTTAKTA